MLKNYVRYCIVLKSIKYICDIDHATLCMDGQKHKMLIG